MFTSIESLLEDHLFIYLPAVKLVEISKLGFLQPKRNVGSRPGHANFYSLAGQLVGEAPSNAGGPFNIALPQPKDCFMPKLPCHGVSAAAAFHTSV